MLDRNVHSIRSFPSLLCFVLLFCVSFEGKMIVFTSLQQNVCCKLENVGISVFNATRNSAIEAFKYTSHLVSINLNLYRLISFLFYFFFLLAFMETEKIRSERNGCFRWEWTMIQRSKRKNLFFLNVHWLYKIFKIVNLLRRKLIEIDSNEYIDFMEYE